MHIIILFALVLIMACSKDDVLTPSDTAPPTVVGLLVGDGSATFVHMNSETGETLLSVPRPEVSGFILGNSAIDTAGSRYFILRRTDTTTQLVSLNARTGAIITSPDIDGLNIGEIEYDPSTGKLLAVRWVGSAPELIRIDPATGTITVIAPLPISTGAQQGGSAYDPQTRRYYLTGVDSLYAISAESGAVVASPGIFERTMSNAQFEPSSGKIVALTSRTGTTEVVRVDPSNGSMSSVGTIPEVEGWTLGEAVVSSSTGRLIFTAMDSTTRRLYSVTLASGSLAARPTIGEVLAVEVLR